MQPATRSKSRLGGADYFVFCWFCFIDRRTSNKWRRPKTNSGFCDTSLSPCGERSDSVPNSAVLCAAKVFTNTSISIRLLKKPRSTTPNVCAVSVELVTVLFLQASSQRACESCLPKNPIAIRRRSWATDSTADFHDGNAELLIGNLLYSPAVRTVSLLPEQYHFLRVTVDRTRRTRTHICNIYGIRTGDETLRLTENEFIGSLRRRRRLVVHPQRGRSVSRMPSAVSFCRVVLLWERRAWALRLCV